MAKEGSIFLTEDFMGFLCFEQSFSKPSILIDMVLNRDLKTNSIKTSYAHMSQKYSRSEEYIRRFLEELKLNGIIEIYKTSIKSFVVIAFRKNDLFEFGDFELFLDESLIVPIRKSKGRNEKGYGLFVKKVLERDNYTCQNCGSKEKLNVHHIKNYADFPDLRTKVSNGVTLCESCHKEIHKKRKSQ